MKRTTFLALAMSLGLAMIAEQAGATVANPGLAAAGANAKQTAAVTKVWWRGGYGPGWHGGYGGYGWRGGWRPGYGGRPGYGWVPFAVFGAAVAATAAAGAYYGPGPYYGYGPGPYYGPCGGGPCCRASAPQIEKNAGSQWSGRLPSTFASVALRGAISRGLCW